MLTRIAGKLVGVPREADPDKGAGGGGNEPSWRDGLPEEMQNEAGLQDFNDVGSLAKSFLDTKAMVGSSIRIPGEDAGDEARAEFDAKLMSASPNLMQKPNFDDAEQSTAFFRSVGMPEKAEGYEMPEVEGIQFPEERGNVMREAAHKSGMSSNQFKSFMKAGLEAEAQLFAANETARAEGMQGLKTEWGMAFDDNYKAASSIAAATGAPEALVNAIASQQAGPDVVKWLHSLKAKLGPEGQQMIDQGDGENNNGRMTPAEAKAKADEILNNKEHPYWQNGHPGHDDAVKKMIELQRMVNPE